jgi:hypothetical protein
LTATTRRPAIKTVCIFFTGDNSGRMRKYKPS